MQFLLELDQRLFFLINDTLEHPVLDAILPLIRNKAFWIPFYVFVATFLVVNFQKKGLILVLGLALTIGVSDTLSSKVVKPYVKRDRPCQNVHIQKEVQLKVRCGGGKSFTSSHATNHFAFAAFLIFFFGRRFPKVKILYLWAGLIAYAQIYVGVHYPFDIIGGMLLGLIIGSMVARFLVARKVLGLESFF